MYNNYYNLKRMVGDTHKAINDLGAVHKVHHARGDRGSEKV